jgi:hypothetical protein
MSEPRRICDIAAEIAKVWRKKDGSTAVYFGAVPYLRAMASLAHIGDDYGCDSGASVVLYFLANASTFRGPDAQRLKAELKLHIEDKKRRVKAHVKELTSEG